MELSKKGRYLRQAVTSTTYVEEPVKELIAHRKSLHDQKEQLQVMIDELDVKIREARRLGHKDEK